VVVGVVTGGVWGKARHARAQLPPRVALRLALELLEVLVLVLVLVMVMVMVLVVMLWCRFLLQRHHPQLAMPVLCTMVWHFVIIRGAHGASNCCQRRTQARMTKKASHVFRFDC
jgi:hypothetical protein